MDKPLCLGEKTFYLRQLVRALGLDLADYLAYVNHGATYAWWKCTLIMEALPEDGYYGMRTFVKELRGIIQRGSMRASACNRMVDLYEKILEIAGIEGYNWREESAKVRREEK